MPKKKRAAKPEQERRVYNSSPIKVRSAAGGKRTIYGYAAKFSPVQSADLGGFIEEIHENAFDACLRAAPDVVGLWNHDPNHVLARTTSGTLRLSTDKTGLQYEIDPPNTNLARDLMESMDRGDIHQSSFGFYCIDDSWREGPNGTYIRTVLKAELIDVSPVTFPAYKDATSGVRASLRNAPASLRSKLKRDEDGDSDFDPTNGTDLDCEGEDADSPECEDENRCDCRCSRCLRDDCKNCVNEECSSKQCAMEGCTAAGQVESLRLRISIHEHRRKLSPSYQATSATR